MQDYQTSDGTVTSGAIRRGFDNHDNGQEYEISLQERDWDVRFGETTAENATISNEYAVSGGQSLRVTYQDDENDAAASSWALPEEDTYYLSYWVLFEDGFDFNGDDHSGGKLPGLASDGLASGGGDVTGENGFTARYMWREDGAAELYLYHMDKPGRYGESFEFVDADDEPIKFQPGEWHQLIQKVTINDDRQANGEITVWMDGQEVLDLDGLRFVTDGSGIDRLYFSSFFGGNDDGW
ncbi:MAG: polysaccharide lyase, partial [Pseudomonadota bacterium]